MGLLYNRSSGTVQYLLNSLKVHFINSWKIKTEYSQSNSYIGAENLTASLSYTDRRHIDKLASLMKASKSCHLLCLLTFSYKFQLK